MSYNPDSWDGIDARDGYEFDTDSGSYSGPEVETLYSLDFTHEPGEIWNLKYHVAFSSEPTDNLIAFEILDEDGDYISQQFLQTYGGNTIDLELTIPTYIVTGDYDAPAPTSGQPDIRLQIAGADGGNYWATVEAVRLRSPLDNSDNYQGPDVGFMSDGPL